MSTPLATASRDASAHEARRPNEWRVGVIAGMASYIDAAAMVGTGIALAIYQATIGLTPGQLGILSGALTFCVAIGSIVGGRLGDTFGRRKVFIITMALIVCGAGLSYASASFLPLFLGIVLIGLGIGADLPVSLATIAEGATDKNRGKLILLSNLLWLLGIVASILIASFWGNLGRAGGQLLFAHVGVIAAIVLVGRLTIPESTVWLEAAARRRAGIVEEAPKAKVADLLKAPYLAPFLALLSFYTLANLGANTTGSFNTFIATTIAGATVEEFNRWALIALLAALLPGLLFMKYVDTPKRMPFYVVGAILATSSYALVGLVGVTLMTMVIALFVAATGHAFAFEGIMKVWTQESFPTMLRSTAQGTILAVARVIAAAFATVTPALLTANARGVFLGLAVVVAIGFAIGGLYFRGSTRNEFALEAEEALA
ncbi:MFS transporter [Actinomyces culturomici]|uniref:MFS transporter n=1 Tax=Actinomyces culturomici TaxID=1926276 RepID=UPI001C55594C|nr:MFS transporter [Actinomyces culturomici]